MKLVNCPNCQLKLVVEHYVVYEQYNKAGLFKSRLSCPNSACGYKYEPEITSPKFSDIVGETTLRKMSELREQGVSTRISSRSTMREVS